MESVRERASWMLTNLPVDILGLLARYFQVPDVISLISSGDKKLHWYLAQPNVITSLKITSRILGEVPAPSCLRYVPLLRTLRLHVNYAPKNAISGIDSSTIPPGVEELELYFVNALDLLASNPSWYHTLPHLRRLKTGSLWDSKTPEHLKESLRNLESLGIYRWNTSASLPPNLTSLTLGEVEVDEAGEVNFPPKLTDLQVVSDFEGSVDRFISALPVDLRSFTITSQQEGVLTIPLEKWPRKLHTLNLYVQLAMPPSWDFGSLESLTELKAQVPKIEYWERLPRSLLSLSLEFVDLEVDGTQLATAIASLPPNLTQLTLIRGSIVFLDNKVKFPPLLRRLRVPLVDFNESSISSLPSELTDLHIAFSDRTLMKKMPQGLLVLKLDCMRLTALESLPPHLRTLKVSSVDAEEMNDEYDGNGMMSTFLERHGEWSLDEDAETLLTEFPYCRIPSSITYLAIFDLRRTNYPLKFIIPSLENINILNFHCSSFVDTDMAQLSPRLVDLNLQTSSKLSSGCFKWLPRGLRYLTLAMLAEIRNQEISDLPPSLHHCFLSKTPYISDKDVSRFPRYIERLTLLGSDMLTPDCVPRLPPNIFKSSGTSFNCTKFSIKDGKVIARL